MKFSAFSFLFLFCSYLQLFSQSTSLVTDLAPGSESAFSEDAVIMATALNSVAIFDRDQVVLSDGTEEGTKTFEVGTNAWIGHHRTVLNDKIYFILNNDENDYSLMELDPVSQTLSTILSDFGTLSNLVSLNDKLYCHAESETFDDDFISVDPTNGITEVIFGLDWFGTMRDVIVHNGMIYSIHWSTSSDGAYLSKSDGTPGNVDEFKFLHNGSEFSQTASINMTSAGENLYFFYYSANSSYALYVSDGTNEGTQVLQEGMQRISFFDYDENKAIGTIGNSIYFRGVLEESSNDEDLWISDGTVEGTCTLRIINEDKPVEPRFFSNYDDKLYFYGFNREGSWSDRSGMIVSDGTKENTIVPYNSFDHPDNLPYTGWQMCSHNDKLYFVSETDENGSELYSSEGPLNSIIRVSDVAEGDGNAQIRKLTSAGENLFFICFTSEFGRELYVHQAGEPTIEYPLYPIGTVNTTNNDGEADSLGVNCTVEGIVHGINFRPGGLTFTLIDADKDGLGVFKNDEDFGYVVNEGDVVSIEGSIAQFNGLTQIEPVSVTVIGSDNTWEAIDTEELNESTESQMVSITGVLDPADWIGDGNSFNIDLEVENGNILTIRVDNDTEMANLSSPPCEGVAYIISGIGGQFDQDAPYDSGYQLFPRYNADFECISETNQWLDEGEISISPNPAYDYLTITSEIDIEKYIITDLAGRNVQSGTFSNKLDISDIIPGIYQITFIKGEKINTQKLLKN